ncbi:methyltransferase domain-containing protein [Hoyosella rhizosphaerae]|uniref:class I SAM-dependent methyltransferase n=1 Tax=Hoyosella rhizosphaerae TaxID=1755582 RepID=UPI00166BC4D7|nr:class I SAM-dependent methyltransferase [Hoyosella rhizosphaerae]MBN4926916.1 methyltransferase domain-containing protein [Hoyosella rhizosphaerae]
MTTSYAANASFWIRIVREELDRFQTELTDRALFDSIGDCKNLVVLDAGCGEGHLTRGLVALGACHVHGVDTSEPLLNSARLHPESDPATSTFHHADVADLPLSESSIDLVVSNRLPHGLTNPERRFVEFSRVLRPGGRMLLLSLHPCFYSGRADNNTSARTHFTVTDYFDGRTVQQHLRVAEHTSPMPTVQRFYSLEQYVGMLTGAGFVITGLFEPHPTTNQMSESSWWRENFIAPLFLLIECTRPA